MNFTFKTILYPTLIFLCLILGYFSHYIDRLLIKPKIKVSQQASALNLNNKLINLFNLGQGRLLSSSLWIKTLMDSDLEHYKKDDLNSWMHLRFKTIAEIDPQFYENYIYGGQYLYF